MSEFIVYQKKVFLDQARVLDHESLAFTNMRVADASSPAALVTLKVGQDDSAGIDLKPGTRLENIPNDSGNVWFTNPAQPGEWILLHYWRTPISGPPRVITRDVTISGGLSINAWYESSRNHKNIPKGYQDTLAPSGFDASWIVYTVPAGRKAKVSGVDLHASRTTAATTAGECTLRVEIQPSTSTKTTIIRRSFNSNVIGAGINEYCAMNTVLSPGDIFRIYLKDLSTGGAVYWSLGAAIDEFDE